MDAWYDELQAFSAGDILLAVRRHLHSDRGQYRPQLADIFRGIDTHDREMAEQRRAQEHAVRQLTASRRGRPAPPEFLAALEIHREASKPTAKPEERTQAAAMIDALAGQLDQRANGHAETVMDATRTCPGCADSPAAGWVAGPPGEDARGLPVPTAIPCPDCRPARYAAWQAGTLHTRAKEPR